MDFNTLFKDLKDEIVTLAKDKFGNQGTAIVQDLEAYLEHSKVKLKRWTLLFAEGKIDKEELTWLLQSQKDLLALRALNKAGISKISLGHFKNKIIGALIRDLHIYELVLLGLGIFLFLILSIGLIYYILKMIGYPSIKEVSISHDRIEFSKTQEDYANNPEDDTKRQKLEELIDKLEKRATTPEDIIQISKAKLLLGNTTEAIRYADMVIEMEKDKKENTTSVETSNPEIPVTTHTPNKQLVYARQLKHLAKVQDNAVKNADTVTLNTNFRNIVLDRGLLKTQQVVRKNTLQKIRQPNN